LHVLLPAFRFREGSNEIETLQPEVPIPEVECSQGDPMNIGKSLLQVPILLVAVCAASGQIPARMAPTSTPTAASAATVVPALVPYSGIAMGDDGKSLAGETGVTFLIYKDEQGGEPLWAETQTVAFDSSGRYKVQLGATSSNGLPSDLFVTGEARWLEVQIAGQNPQPRLLLASVPYALKAADASSLGGLPASAYALAGPSSKAAATAGIVFDAVSTVTTTGGTVGYVPEFSGAATIVDSPVFILGADVGIGTTTPTATLDVNGAALVSGALTANGGATIGGPLVLPALGTATASGGFNSQLLKMYTSAYNSSTKAAVDPHFEWEAVETGNNTASPTATLELLASNGPAGATGTGFSFNSNGTINFAPGQTFPATSSTGTAVDGSSTSGIGVEGNSNSGIGVEGYSSSDSGIGVEGYSASGIGTLAVSTSGIGTVGESTSNFGVQGASISSSGVFGVTQGTTGHTAGLYGVAGKLSGYTGGVISGVWGDSANHVGVTGTSVSFPGVEGESTSSFGLSGVSANYVGVSGLASLGVAGVLGTFASSSSVGEEIIFKAAGAWGDAGGTNCNPGNAFLCQGVLGTTDDGFGGTFYNNTASGEFLPALYASNSGTGDIFTAQSGTTTSACTIDQNANLYCDGKIAEFSATPDSRTLTTYSVQAAENWYEDAGSGQLQAGSTHIALDPNFGATVNTGVEYHVFLTPDGDCKGLYVSAKSNGGFDVRELGGGTSNISFEYRIMAKRRGYENVRLEDVTDRVAKMAAQRAKMLRPASAGPQAEIPAQTPQSVKVAALK
jgi:hypothetical protein